MNKPAIKTKPGEITVVDEPGTLIQPQAPIDYVALAIERNVPPEVLAKLIDNAARLDAIKARKSFDNAVAEVKKKLKPVIRNRAGHNNKKYADFAAIATSVDPVLAEEGLSYRFRSDPSDRINVTCVLAHRDGHFEETTLSAPADQTGNKNAVQAIGSTLTYLQRYSLVQMLGLAVADDDDGRAAGGGGGGGVISAEQVDTLNKLLLETKVDVEKFLTLAGGVPSVSDILAAKYANALAWLQAKQRQQKKVQS